MNANTRAPRRRPAIISLLLKLACAAPTITPGPAEAAAGRSIATALRLRFSDRIFVSNNTTPPGRVCLPPC